MQLQLHQTCILMTCGFYPVRLCAQWLDRVPPRTSSPSQVLTETVVDIVFRPLAFASHILDRCYHTTNPLLKLIQLVVLPMNTRK